MLQTKIGIIGGSGLYGLEGLENGKWIDIDTPYGRPSDQLYSGIINGIEIFFLPRHGRGHLYNPTNIPYLANIYALKSLGVTDILSFSAVGSLNEIYKPGDFLIIDQFVDRTYQRPKTFFDQECVAHVSFNMPTCRRLGDVCKKVMDELSISHHLNGTYITIEGPQFSTLAESLLYKDVWKCDVVGMTNMPEAKLIREAEICYASIGMVTDYDCWHPDHSSVKVSDIIETQVKNVDKARSIIAKVSENTKSERTYCQEKCNQSLDNSIMTKTEMISSELRERLSIFIDRLM